MIQEKEIKLGKTIRKPTNPEPIKAGQSNADKLENEAGTSLDKLFKVEDQKH